MIIGHACTESDTDEYELPSNVTYISSGICGFSTYGNSTLNQQFIQGFFDNDKLYQQSPEKLLMIDPVMEHSPKENFVQRKTSDGNTENDPTYLVINRPKQGVLVSRFSFLYSFVLDDTENQVSDILNPVTGTWNAYKSGIYRFDHKLKKYPRVVSNISVTIPINYDLGNTYITVAEIRDIYEDSIYPTTKRIIAKINELLKKTGESSHSISSKNPTDKCSLLIFEIAVENLSSDLSTIIRWLKKHTNGPIRLYDPLCKGDCHLLGTDYKEERREQDKRRRASEWKLATGFLNKDLLKELA